MSTIVSDNLSRSNNNINKWLLECQAYCQLKKSTIKFNKSSDISTKITLVLPSHHSFIMLHLYFNHMVAARVYYQLLNFSLCSTNVLPGFCQMFGDGEMSSKNFVVSWSLVPASMKFIWDWKEDN